MRPQIQIEIAFNQDDWTSFADPGVVWEDVTRYLLSASISIGREFEADDFPAASATLNFKNLDYRFDFDYDESPYQGQDPISFIRVKATWLGVTYGLFFGFITSQSITSSQIFDGVCTIQALDGLSLLGLYPVTATFDEESSGSRVAAVADAVGWPESARDFDPGVIDVIETILEATKALDHIQHVCESEFGIIFCDGDGNLVFQDRDRLLVREAEDPVSTFGEKSTPLHSALVIDRSSGRIFNTTEATLAGDDAIVERTDEASATKYGLRPYPGLTNLLVTDSTEAEDLCDLVIACHSSPRTRLKPLAFTLPYSIEESHQDDGLWAAILPLKMQDFVAVQRLRSNGSQTTYRANVQKIQYELNAQALTFTASLAVTPSTVFTPWILEDDVYGILGETTYLG